MSLFNWRSYKMKSTQKLSNYIRTPKIKSIPRENQCYYLQRTSNQNGFDTKVDESTNVPWRRKLAYLIHHQNGFGVKNNEFVNVSCRRKLTYLIRDQPTKGKPIWYVINRKKAKPDHESTSKSQNPIDLATTNAEISHKSRGRGISGPTNLEIQVEQVLGLYPGACWAPCRAGAPRRWPPPPPRPSPLNGDRGPLHGVSP